ncbi:MAG: PadR family transcriptional regulator [Candidatus Bathyarchaeales archaeon]
MFQLRKHWMKHTALVPKGFLRQNVLELLNEKPMSGSEIIDEIEKRTNGRWKPSPGSVYPLLAWLQDNGYVKEIIAEEGGMKRYALTDKGKALLEEGRKIKEKLQREAKFLPPPFLGTLWFKIPPEKTVKLRESMNRVVCAFFELTGNLQESFSEKVIEDVQKVLDETAAKLEEINKRFGK